MLDKRASLTDAVATHVQSGDVLHPMVGHTRWTAAMREVARQWWGRDPGFTLVMLSLSSLGALFFRGGLVRKVVTGYSGDTFPNFTPNQWFARAYERGEPRARRSRGSSRRRGLFLFTRDTSPSGIVKEEACLCG